MNEKELSVLLDLITCMAIWSFSRTFESFSDLINYFTAFRDRMEEQGFSAEDYESVMASIQRACIEHYHLWNNRT